MRAKVYIETSIPSFCFEVRTEPNMVARRDWTREWWDSWRATYDLFTSAAVMDELEDGGYPNKSQVVNLVTGLTLLEINEPIADIVQVYLRHSLMPRDPLGDALHLACASFYRCDFLLTWNCQHLANANKSDHIRRINGALDLYVPKLVTPLELLGISS